MQVRPCDLASGRHAWFSFKMLAALLISLSQSSNFEVSHLSNVGMSWSKDVVRFVCHCLAHKVSVYLYIAVCRTSSMGLQSGHSWSIMTSCCSLLGGCASSLTCKGGLAVGPSWLSHSWSSWKCFCNSTRSLSGLVFSLYSVVVSLSRYSMFWVGGVVSRGVVSLGQVCFSIVHGSFIIVPHCHGVSFMAFLVIVEQSFERWLSVVVGHLHMVQCLWWEWGKVSHLPGNGYTENHERLL